MKNYVSKLLIGMGVAAFVAAGLLSPAYAVPTLQLDACVMITETECDGVNFSSYDTDPPGTDTIIIGTDVFSVLAIGTPNGTNNPNKNPAIFTTKDSFLDKDFYLSIAVIPQLPADLAGEDRDLGSFDISWGGNTTTVQVVDDMVWGIPPAATLEENPEDLAPHGVFETFFYEQMFQFDYDNMIPTYNTQCRFFVENDCEGVLLSDLEPTEDPEAIPDLGSGDSLFHKFDIDISNLDPTIGLHFDLYYTTDRIQEFAPYSHDVETGEPPCDAPPGAGCGGERIPEPGTMLMFAFGLLSMVFIRRRVACRV